MKNSHGTVKTVRKDCFFFWHAWSITRYRVPTAENVRKDHVKRVWLCNQTGRNIRHKVAGPFSSRSRVLLFLACKYVKNSSSFFGILQAKLNNSFGLTDHFVSRSNPDVYPTSESLIDRFCGHFTFPLILINCYSLSCVKL